ncbi:MAG: hypothetical protein FJZ58_04495 [Chlamydiae bacterium]|nr:hypothetical protein [Chlamydiota bacterium]
MFKFFITSCLLSSFLRADPLPPEPLIEAPQHLVIHNRILAKIHNTTISVLDLVKKMELFFYKYYPQYADSPSAKYQFFSSQWKDVLLQTIDHELILADAEKMDLKVTDSEVRESLFERFGPNIMLSLNKLGLQYEEARTMIHAELVVQRMTWFKVHAKALANVNSQDIKNAYANYLEKNPAKETWDYRILSIRSKDAELATHIAELAHALCNEHPHDLDKVLEEIQPSIPLQEGTSLPLCSLSLSELVSTETKNLSTAYRDILASISPLSCSAPVRKESSEDTLYRIFFLAAHTVTSPPSFRNLYNRLQSELVQQAADAETKLYLTKLRKRYGFTLENLAENIPDDFQPFSLQ